MPIYEYLCGACGRPCELMQKMSDPPATTCPHCGAEALSKQISAAGFRLKGGGWYETDFKKDGRRNLADAAAASAAPSGETKPAEAKASEAKPAESKPAAAAPASSTPSSSGGAAGA